jgi:hypothetical protein
MLLTIVLSLSLAGTPKVDERLVGTWLAGGAPFVTFNANGTGAMDDGKVKWSADGKTLVVVDDENSTDTLPYVVDGANLTLNMGGVPMVLTRATSGVGGKKQGPLSAKAAKGARVAEAEQPRAAGPSQLAQLLLSSAWCSFSYNKVSGASSSTRFQFFRDGTWSNGGRSESYNSGAYGSMAGQTDSSNRGRWEVRNEQLFMSSPENPVLQLVQGSITRNSNGSPIITASGREYSACQ